MNNDLFIDIHVFWIFCLVLSYFITKCWLGLPLELDNLKELSLPNRIQYRIRFIDYDLNGKIFARVLLNSTLTKSPDEKYLPSLGENATIHLPEIDREREKN